MLTTGVMMLLSLFNDPDEQEVHLLKGSAQRDFERFQKTFSKSYTTRAEMLVRQKNYSVNMAYIKNINNQNRGYELEENQFTDLSWEEFQQRFL